MRPMSFFGPPNVEKLKAKRDIKGLVKALEYKDYSVQWQAALALRDVGDKRAVPAPIDALRGRHATPGRPDREVGMSKVAAEALREIGDAQGLEELHDEDSEVRKRAAETLKDYFDVKLKMEEAPARTRRPPASFEEAIANLISIYHSHPEGFVRGEGGEDEREIRQIGDFLNRQGGLELMKDAHAVFARGCARGCSRNLEFMWDGIGGWQG